MKSLIIKFMRARVTKPHHSAAMRQVVKESLTGGMENGRRMMKGG